MSAFPEIFTEDEIVELAEKERYDEIKDKAVEELEGVFEVEADEIDLEIDRSIDTFGRYTEDREILVNPEFDSGSPEIVGEAIYEEAAHILTTQDTHEKRHGERRKHRDEWNVWESAANEILGALPRWGEKFDLERSINKSIDNLEKIDPEEPGSRKVGEYINDIVHHIGYSISQHAKEQGYEASELAEMSYQELYDEFEDEAETIREELLENHGVFVDWDADATTPDPKLKKGSLDSEEEEEAIQAAIYEDQENYKIKNGKVSVKTEDGQEYSLPAEDFEIEASEPPFYLQGENKVYGFGRFKGRNGWHQDWWEFRETEEEMKEDLEYR